MSKRVTPTIIICLMAATTAGIALARPGSTESVSASGSEATAAPAAGTAASEEPAAADNYDYSEDESEAEAVNEGTTADGASDDGSTGTVGEGIVIDQFLFTGNMTVAAGQTVTVDNVDGAQHTLTSNDGLFDTGVLDSGGGSGTFVAPTEPGTYTFFCAIHPSMTGTLTVTG